MIRSRNVKNPILYLYVWNHISKYITYDRSLLSFKFALRKYVNDDDTLLGST